MYLITRDEFNWVVLNPTRLCLEVIIPAVDIAAPLPIEMVGAHDSVIKVLFAQRDIRKHYGHFGLYNCVVWCKYMLGLNVWAFTPYAFYQRILKLTPLELKKLGVLSVERVK